MDDETDKDILEEIDKAIDEVKEWKLTGDTLWKGESDRWAFSFLRAGEHSDGGAASKSGVFVVIRLTPEQRRKVLTLIEKQMGVCCEMMAKEFSRTCAVHPDRQLCGDNVIHRDSKGRYGLIIHDGGHSTYLIQYCPWCGKRFGYDG
jgi:hypothetical protein